MRRALAFVLVSAIGTGTPAAAQRQAGSRPLKTPPATAEPVAAPVTLPEPPLPVQQAQAVGLGRCTAILDLMSRKTLTSRYDAQSGWSRGDPSHHVFQSVAALVHPGNVPPDGMAALIAAPLAAGPCDGVAVQVFPLAGDCQSAQKVIMKGGKTLGPLVNARIMQDAGGNRLFLLPGFANTCIAIAVDTYFGVP